jgi:hypothetical protein
VGGTCGTHGRGGVCVSTVDVHNILGKVVDSLLGHHLLLLMEFGPYVIVFMNMCIMTVAIVW